MKYKKGELVIGTVSGITEYGIFVKFDDLYSGLIHISEISEKFVSNINNYVKIGNRIKAKIIDVDDDKCHLKISIKGIDYKDVDKLYNGKIIETPKGFSTLHKNLNFWIEQYLKNKKINKYY